MLLNTDSWGHECCWANEFTTHTVCVVCVCVCVCVQVEGGDIKEFTKIVGSGNILTTHNGDDLDAYNVDWMKNFR